MSLPVDFLKQLEQYSELTDRQKYIFIQMFGYDQSKVQIANTLNTSPSNISTHLTGIYKKFQINDDGPVKQTRLREYLENRYSRHKNAKKSTIETVENEIETLVQEIRTQVIPHTKEKCGTMRVLDMEQPIELTGERGIYTSVNILEKLSGRRRLEIGEILQKSSLEEFNRFGLHQITEKRVPGLEAVKNHSKLMVLGKPGAGKTTFLKYLAMHCIEGDFLTNRIPFFINLKEFAEKPKQPHLLEYLAQILSICNIKEAENKLDKILRNGKTLILLDGLDEVREEDTKRILNQILEISDQFHTNQFVMTCRIAAKEYTFERFTEVEMADFDKEQIATFSQNWFRLTDPVKADRFIQRLKENQPIYELATNPLLLTLLCLVFGENNDFPSNRSDLYKEGVDILLKKWDAKRNIEREQVYKNLSLQRKQDLLSQIAFTTFEQKEYFFKQKTLEGYIADFIHNLRDARTKPEELELDSEAVLKSIESQHGLFVERAKGIYSFSHLTFHEYFTARKIVTNSECDNLIENISDRRWRTIFILTAEMIPKTDDLIRLMKRKIDQLLANDSRLQDFLVWLYNKANSVTTSYKHVASRAFYFILGHALIFNQASAYTMTKRQAFLFAYAFDSSIIHSNSSDFEIDLALAHAHDQAYGNHLLSVKDLDFDFNNSHIFHIYPKLHYTLQELRNQLPSTSYEDFNFWWTINGYNWSCKLRKVIIEHRNIGHNWQFNDIQLNLLEQYYYAMFLLMECLNSNFNVSREVRNEIEDTLLLPMSEIEKRKKGLENNHEQ